MNPVSKLRHIVIATALAAGLAGCAASEATQVARTVTVDDKGRKVTLYRVCEPAPWSLSFNWRPVCRTERVTENYCYRSLADVDCYDQPWPGRTRTSLVR